MSKARPKVSNKTRKPQPRSRQIGEAGINTAADYRRFATAIAVDVISGRLGYREAGAAGAQLKSVIKIVELEHRYGYSKANRENRSVMLLGA